MAGGASGGLLLGMVPGGSTTTVQQASSRSDMWESNRNKSRRLSDEQRDSRTALQIDLLASAKTVHSCCSQASCLQAAASHAGSPTWAAAQPGNTCAAQVQNPAHSDRVFQLTLSPSYFSTSICACESSVGLAAPLCSPPRGQSWLAVC
jgi:hypothetical protein